MSMETFSDEFVQQIYNLPKTPEAVSEFLNSYYDEVQPDGSIKKRMVWERFEASYVKVTRHYNDETFDDEADVYMYAHKLVSRCVLAEVAPYFESDGQLFSYFQLMVRNSRINDSVKESKHAFLLIDDLVNKEDADDSDYSNFEEKVFGDSAVAEYDKGGIAEVLELIDGLGEPDLVLFGRLFVNNNFSFEGLYGLCGFDLAKFKSTKKRFIKAIKERYGK